MVGEPLAGCVMVITADRRKRELASALERRGAIVRHAPALSTIPHMDDERLIADTRALIASPPDIVVATTGIGFRGWIEAADAAGLAEDLIDAMRGARLVARGPKARGAIQQAGLEADWVAESETAAELRDYLLAEGVAGLRVAVQHHGNGSDGLDEAFTQAGADVQSLLVYGWGEPLQADLHREWVGQAAAGGCDAVLFTSAPGAESWLAEARAQGVLATIAARAAAGELVLAAVGPVTAAPLREAGLLVAFPDRWRLGALVRMLVQQFTDSAVGVPTPDGPLVMRATAAVLEGRVLPLTPTGLEILRALARAKGNVLTREQLGAVLPGAQAGPHAVEAAINRLRENSGAPTLVRTVVKRGYALAVTAA
ncbi:uroporphyrinogen-III synthase [Demequina sp. SYSU T00039]|uniref:Uroporphyrinogen-III synthase n=1 Tax=Demequina lignilytica TaxID=3051663 RepID=A0AAW7M6Y6_9MICO|nr:MULTISPECIES: uroporphyrinogen-III synthase [unclassified Demequina]MDN4478425.1 uroporphyrinogen-III synthase [Demequina sp. SYSU T00039-1]MDN4487068.1 uroporphyrinogen-III synthase [Demequina sp. SYSU T00039]MDN4489779.1 uroporphyrinogen-III synthase [Demequina sp. SYSU T00068]